MTADKLNVTSGRIPLRNYTPPYVFSKPNVMGFLLLGRRGSCFLLCVCVCVCVCVHSLQMRDGCLLVDRSCLNFLFTIRNYHS